MTNRRGRHGLIGRGGMREGIGRMTRGFAEDIWKRNR